MGFYSEILTRRPIVTKSITCALLVSAGDFMGQLIEMWCKGKACSVDGKRVWTMGLYGGVYVGPVLHLWYSLVLGRYFKTPGLLTTAKKTLVDQAIFAPFGCCSFFVGLTLLNGGTLAESQAKTNKELWPTLVANWSIWPAVQVFNFGLVPIPYQVLVVNSVAIFWNAYLSYVQFSKK